MGHRLRDSRGRYKAAKSEGAREAEAVSKPARPVRAAKALAKAKAAKAAPAKWPKEKEAAFFRELAVVCNVSAALRAAGLVRRSRDVYDRRKKDAAFREQWEEALSESRAMMALELHERARFGDARPEPASEVERKLRAVPTALAVQLLKLYESRAAKAAAAAQPTPRRDPERRRALRAELLERLAEFNRRMGGDG